MSLVISERSSQMQELRRQLSLKDQELCELRREKEREVGGEMENLQSLLKEKEAFIKVSVHDILHHAHVPTYLYSPSL